MPVRQAVSATTSWSSASPRQAVSAAARRCTAMPCGSPDHRCSCPNSPSHSAYEASTSVPPRTPVREGRPAVRGRRPAACQGAGTCRRGPCSARRPCCRCRWTRSSVTVDYSSTPSASLPVACRRRPSTRPRWIVFLHHPQAAVSQLAAASYDSCLLVPSTAQPVSLRHYTGQRQI